MVDVNDSRRRSTQRLSVVPNLQKLSSVRGSIGYQYKRSRNMRGTIQLHPMCRKGKVRRFLYDIVESKSFHIFMLLIILTNTALIGLQTVPSIQNGLGWYLSLLSIVYLAVYLVEFALKFCALRMKYFYDQWNLFDFFIVLTSLFDFIWPLAMKDSLSVDTDIFKVFRLLKSFRALRALRVIRTIQFLKNLQITVSAIIQSIPALGSIIMLIGLVLYIFAIIGKGLYQDVDSVRFGNIGYASFTLFQLITLDDWYFVYSEINEEHPEYWHILIYLVVFIILENFIFINLFIAVIVDNLERAHANARDESLQITASVESMDSREVVTAMALDEDQILEEVPPSAAVEYYYEGRRDNATKHIAMFTELLATLEYYTERNQTPIRNLNKLLDLAKKQR